MTEVKLGKRIEVDEEENKPLIQLQEVVKSCPDCNRSYSSYSELNDKIKTA